MDFMAIFDFFKELYADLKKDYPKLIKVFEIVMIVCIIIVMISGAFNIVFSDISGVIESIFEIVANFD